MNSFLVRMASEDETWEQAVEGLDGPHALQKYLRRGHVVQRLLAAPHVRWAFSSERLVEEWRPDVVLATGEVHHLRAPSRLRNVVPGRARRAARTVGW